MDNSDDQAAGQTEKKPAPQPVRPTFQVREKKSKDGSKPKPAWLKILPPVLGGLAALPLATGILWYGFGRDLGNAGPAVAQYVPWVVPKHLRGSSFRPDGTLARFEPTPKPPSTARSPSDLPYSQAASGAEIKSDLPALGAALSINEPLQSSVPDPALKAALDKLRWYEAEWGNIPRERGEQLKAVSEFYGSLCDLARYIDTTDQATLDYWHEHRDSVASLVLNDTKFLNLVRRCSTGDIPGMVKLEPQAYVVIELTRETAAKSAFHDSPEESSDWPTFTTISGSSVRVLYSDEHSYPVTEPEPPNRKEHLLVLGRLEVIQDDYVLRALDGVMQVLDTL
ncbi:hypothetical protein SH449x_001229 [Pirellulaceae bacterium SH449]